MQQLTKMDVELLLEWGSGEHYEIQQINHFCFNFFLCLSLSLSRNGNYFYTAFRNAKIKLDARQCRLHKMNNDKIGNSNESVTLINNGS